MFELEFKIIRVALNVPLRRLFDYALTEKQNGLTICAGQRVLVPFGNKSLVAIVVDIDVTTDVPASKLKAIIDMIDVQPVLNEEQISFLNWAAKYYQHPLGDVYYSALPKLLRENRQLDSLLPESLVATELMPKRSEFSANAKKQLQLYDLLKHKTLSRTQLTEHGITAPTIKKFVDQKWAEWQNIKPAPTTIDKSQLQPGLALNAEQALAVAAINQCFGHTTFLLDGVTGSGKTEVYLQAIEQRLLKQQQILVLVPEIGLTPQTIKRFEQRFKLCIALWHSGMTDKQRFDTWQKTQSGEAKIIISTRSGVFLPFENLGLIIIDEEHDPSFKQQDGFKYHSRSIALYRANKFQIPVVLGSATPCLETLNNAMTQKFHHLKLNQRAAGSQMPTMKLLDLNLCPQDSGLGTPLIERIGEQLKQGHQVMLFINRRGYAPVLMCEECHWLTECHRCTSYMTYHRNINQLICHHCGHQHPTVHQCMSCGSTRLTSVGIGTEQLEYKLRERFPDIPLTRLDRDSTSKKGQFQEVLEKINQSGPQIIVGTQMIAKGHHFPNVSLVAVVDVDGALFSSDFRAPEKLVQLIVQVSGRAGRGSIKGEVWLQTRFPEHPVIQDVVNNTYNDFAVFTLNERKMLHLPPFSHHILLKAESTHETAGLEWLNGLLPHLRPFANLQTLGPSPAAMMKKAGKFRFLLTLQCQSRPYLHKVVDWLIENLDTIQKDNRIRWSIDVDPIDHN